MGPNPPNPPRFVGQLRANSGHPKSLFGDDRIASGWRTTVVAGNSPSTKPAAANGLAGAKLRFPGDFGPDPCQNL
jgi:hypothetical protein